MPIPAIDQDGGVDEEAAGSEHRRAEDEAALQVEVAHITNESTAPSGDVEAGRVRVTAWE